MFHIQAINDVRERRIRIEFGFSNPTNDEQVNTWGSEIRQHLDQVEELLQKMLTRQQVIASHQTANDPEFQRMRQRELDMYLGQDAYSQWIKQNQEMERQRRAAKQQPKPCPKTLAEIQAEVRRETDQFFGIVP